MGADKNGEIRINRKMRTWNKYKNYVFGGVAIIIVIIAIAMITKSCGKSKEEDTTPSSIQNTTPVQQTEAQTTTQEPTTQEPTTIAAKSKVYTSTKTIAKEEFTKSDFYSTSVFFGDSIVNGIEYYNHLGPDKVVSDVNVTTDKATKYISDVVMYNPSKVFVMIGINDLNYGTRSTETIVSNYKALVSELHTKLPSAEIYIVSVLPITKAYESKTTVYIKNTAIDSLNTQLKTMVESVDSVSFVDIAPSFKDSAGYLDSNATSNGLNLTNAYYGFMLNTIAELVK